MDVNIEFNRTGANMNSVEIFDVTGFSRMQLSENKESCKAFFSKVTIHHYCLYGRLSYNWKYDWLFTSAHMAVKNSNCTD